MRTLNLKEHLEKRIRGWLPKEPLLASFQAKSRILVVFMIVLLAVLIIPIYYLALEANAFFGASWIIVYIAAVLVMRYIISKMGYPEPSPSAHRTQIMAQRVRIVICSGLFTAFAVGTASRLIAGPLPSYFWIPFIILIVVGAFIGDMAWKKLRR